MLHPAVVCSCLLPIFALAAFVRADEQADARKGLEELGVRVFTSGVVLASESDLAKELNKAAALKRALLDATKSLQAAQQLEAKGKQTLTELRKQQVVLNAQLAANNPNNVARNNMLVGALNALGGQFDLIKRQLTELDEKTKAARAQSSEAREAYIQFTLDARKLADQISADYEAKAADAQIVAALGKYNQAAGKEFKLAPSPSFTSAARRLTQIEETVLSESVPLLGEGRNVKSVNVVIGKHQKEMMVDSGASSITLPFALADKLGLKPTENDPKVIMTLADGREIEGRRKIIPLVRVGKFTVENVECAVLGEDAPNAEPLLGMSFLGHFKFELDTDAKTLTMVKIAGTDSAKASK